MGAWFSGGVEEGFRLVWLQYGREGMLHGKRLLEEAASLGDADAYCLLARTYLGGEFVWRHSGLETDASQGARLLKEGIRRGSACGVLTALRSGDLTPATWKNMPFRELKEAWEAVLERAEAGHPFGQLLIGDAYCWGDWFTVSGQAPRKLYATESECARAVADLAVPWLENALKGGLAYAGKNLVRLYRLESAPRPAEARRVTQACAGLGAPDWEERMGRLLQGEGKRQEAFQWFLTAAEHGQATCWACLGNAYLRGEGTKADAAQALQCFEIGARAGDPAAQRDLAWIYFEGGPVPVDEARAAYWAGKAAEAAAGEREYAYPLLAHCMFHGLGMPKDEETALDLLQAGAEFNLSGENGFRCGIRDCRLLYRDLGEACERGLDNGTDLVDRAARAYELAAREFGDGESAGRLPRFKKGMFGKWKLK